MPPLSVFVLEYLSPLKSSHQTASVRIDSSYFLPNRAPVNHKREGPSSGVDWKQGTVQLFLPLDLEPRKVSSSGNTQHHPRRCLPQYLKNETIFTTVAPLLPPACICNSSSRDPLPLRLSLYVLRRVSLGPPLLQTKHTSNAPHESSLPYSSTLLSRYS